MIRFCHVDSSLISSYASLDELISRLGKTLLMENGILLRGAVLDLQSLSFWCGFESRFRILLNNQAVWCCMACCRGFGGGLCKYF